MEAIISSQTLDPGPSPLIKVMIGFQNWSPQPKIFPHYHFENSNHASSFPSNFGNSILGGNDDEAIFQRFFIQLMQMRKPKLVIAGYDGSEMMSLEEEISHLQKENNHVDSQLHRMKSDVSGMETDITSEDKVCQAKVVVVITLRDSC
jgi:hypothetical protein